MKIAIYDLIQDKSYPDAGTLLYDKMSKQIDSVDRIILDFTGVSSVPSMFLNVSIGRFINERGVDFIKNKITFSNITASQAQRIRDYVSRF